MEAIGDLFEYYLAAPRLLGGGVDKAAELASRVRYLDVAEYHYELARLAEKHKQFQAAEHHYRLAVEWAPNDPSRLIDLAEFVEARGRQRESDEIFRRAREIAPRRPIVWFEQARTYVTSHRNIESARSLLKSYLSSVSHPQIHLATKQQNCSDRSRTAIIDGRPRAVPAWERGDASLIQFVFDRPAPGDNFAGGVSSGESSVPAPPALNSPLEAPFTRKMGDELITS